MTTLRFLGDVPILWGSVLAALAAVATWLYYRADVRNVSGIPARLIPVLRSTAIALVVLVLTGPVLHHRKVHGRLGRVLLLVDASQSMATIDAQEQGEDIGMDSAQQDRLASLPRIERVERLLTGGDGLLQRLRDTHEVELVVLRGRDSERLWHSLSADAAPDLLNAAPLADETDLTGELSRRWSSPPQSQEADATASSASNHQPTGRTAVVLFSDGQHNAGSSPLELAASLGQRQIPLYSVGFGDLREPPDLTVLEVQHPDLVSAQSRMRGTLVWIDQLASGTEIVARIMAGDRVLWQQTLTSQQSGLRRTEFDFDVQPLVDELDASRSDTARSDAGQHDAIPVVLHASLESAAHERNASNNHHEFRFLAATHQHRLLLIDGRSRWETRYLKNLFERDPAWQLDAFIAVPSDGSSSLPRGGGSRHFPADAAALGENDLIVFGELAPGILQTDELQWIHDYVAAGGGIVFVDGSRGHLRQLQQGPLGDLLPVRWTAQPPATATALRLTATGSAEPWLRLVPESEENESLWQQLPPPRSMAVVEAAPAAEVLVEAITDRRPIPAVIHRRFAAGHVLYLAFDETWRWRYKAGDRFQARFWNQLSRACMQQPYAVHGRFAALDTGALQYSPSDSPPIRVRLRDPAGRPVSSSTVDAMIWQDGRQVASIGLAPAADVPGAYQGNAPTMLPGEYEVTIRASEFDASALDVKSFFRVAAPPTAESHRVACNEALLRQMSDLSGGRYTGESEAADRLTKWLQPLSRGQVFESDTLLWQSYGWFWAVMGLLTAEWLLRKRIGLL